MKDKLPTLTKREYDIMNILWNTKEEIRLPKILEQLEKNTGIQFKRQTISTFLNHLTNKGIVQSRREGRFFYYKALVSLDVYRQKETEYLINFWYNKSVTNLLLTLYQENYLDKNTFKELERLMRQLR